MVADIPGYNVFKKIGAGGFGTAYLVQRKSDGQRYVGKQIYVSDINSNDFHHALLEVRMLRSLSSRRIVKYVDFLVHGNNCNIIMEYCDGGDLQKVVDDHKRSQVIIPERQISLWMSQVAEALDFCHNQCPPIIHRDVKLQNIFVMADMKKCKLGDFGIAKSLSGRNDFAKTIIGTPVNFCPELCEGRQYSSKADVWAYGCVLYEQG